MSEKMFQFDPKQYADHFAREGWVHIKKGVTDDFYRKMVKQVEESMATKTMKQFAIGDKQQAMYEFPEGGDYLNELRQSVGGVTGLKGDDIVVSERHVKAYDATAAAEPNAHKDRFASEISVGLSVHVKEGSTLVLYPSDELDVNPFNASQHLRAAMSEDQYPEPKLKQVRKVEIKDSAGDVIMFRGHSTWHLRANPALTTMLYLKVNALNCDPLGEDDRTPMFRQRTMSAVEKSDSEMENLVPMVGRRVDYIHKHYDRFWNEVPGVVLFGEKHFSLDEDEFRFLRGVDSKRTVGAILRGNEVSDRAAIMKKVRRIAKRGVIDLV